MSAVTPRRAPLTGAAAGAITAIAFAALHHLIISDIWFSLVPMMVAGAACGASLAWSYALLFEEPAPATWLGYNLTWALLLVLLGVVSVAVYEPITTIQALLVANGPPTELMGQAAPLTVGFTLVAALAIAAVRGRSVRQAAAVLITCVVLVLLFGLNVSVLGLVAMSGDGVNAIALFFALIGVILLINAGAFWLLERRRLFAPVEPHAAGRAAGKVEPGQSYSIREH